MEDKLNLAFNRNKNGQDFNVDLVTDVFPSLRPSVLTVDGFISGPTPNLPCFPSTRLNLVFCSRFEDSLLS
jgi:hypothetical protein